MQVLKASARALCEEYDVGVLDLDGVVYIGPRAVDGAPDRLDEVVTAGMHLAYITNNASRPPAVVGDHLRSLGIHARDEDVVTSAQAAARLLAGQVEPGSSIYVIGGDGLFQALAEHGLVGVQSMSGHDAEGPVAVVSGFAADLRWRTVIDGAILVRRGLPWVATNTDLTVPTEHGPGPGNGVLVDAVARYAGREPVVAGKPRQPLFQETLLRVGGRRPLVVGDRLDTDIDGANGAGLDSLLVMTGVTGLSELVAAPPRQRPTYVSAGLGGLLKPHPLVTGSAEQGYRLDRWHARVQHGELVVTGTGDPDSWWRVVATAAWSHLDAQAGPVGIGGVVAPGSVAQVSGPGTASSTGEDGDGVDPATRRRGED